MRNFVRYRNESGPNHSRISTEKGFTFEFLLRQPEDYFEAWRWMKSCNALQGALSDFLQTVNTFVIFLLSTNLLLIKPRQNKHIFKTLKLQMAQTKVDIKETLERSIKQC